MLDLDKDEDELYRVKLEIIRAKEAKVKLMEGLPFLHGYKHYPWSRKFWDSTAKVNLLCAGNQCGKSVASIRKCIYWATHPELWEKLWPGQKPNQFWYMYPSNRQVTSEFITKWLPLLPQGEWKNHPQFGWKLHKNGGVPSHIQFNSGITLFIRTYTQDVSHLQAASVHAIFADEEMPVDVYDEIIFRISATGGYFHMVFTATLGQEFWRDAMEEQNTPREKLKGALKITVSMYDCLLFEDGEKSHWTEEKINEVKNRCKNQNEILKRVYGRFVTSDDGRKYEQFDNKRHMCDPRAIDPAWHIYAGVDSGSGGVSNHPAAICFVAVRPDFRAAEVFCGWRGDGEETTSSDILQKFRELRGELRCTGQYYDSADRDFFNIAVSAGEPFIPADKHHSVGEHIINVLFKNDMMYVHDTPELRKLSHEMMFLMSSTKKNKAVDDFCDSLRYAVSKIPWDFSGLTGAPTNYKPEMPEPEMSPAQRMLWERRYRGHVPKSEKLSEVEQELEEWGDLFDA